MLKLDRNKQNILFLLENTAKKKRKLTRLSLLSKYKLFQLCEKLTDHSSDTPDLHTALSVLVLKNPRKSDFLLNTILVNCFVAFSTALSTQTRYPLAVSTTNRPPRRCNISPSKIPLIGLLSVSLHSQISCYQLSLLLLFIILFTARYPAVLNIKSTSGSTCTTSGYEISECPAGT